MDTISLFDNMEMDTTQQRVASRRALALAHNRVETNLGRFLRGARTEEEFLERLGLVQDDFAGYVTTASAEVSHDYPEAIAAALKDHYRMAVKGVEFEKTPEEEEEEKKEAAVRKAEYPPGLPRTHQPGDMGQGVYEYDDAGRCPQCGQWDTYTGQPCTRCGYDESGPDTQYGNKNAPDAMPWGMNHPHPPGVQSHVRTWQRVAIVPPVDPTQDPMQPQVPGMQAQAPGGAPVAPGGHPGAVAPGGGMPPPAPPGSDPNQPVDPMLMNRRGHKQGSPLAREAGVGPGPGGPQDPWGGADMKGFNKMNPLEGPAQQGIGRGGEAYPVPVGDEAMHQCPNCGSMNHESDPMTGNPRCLDCGHSAAPEYGYEDQYPPEEEYPEHPSGHMLAGAENPAEQNDDSSRLVTCPECGGDGKTAGATKCNKCAGKGKVPNFGDPIAQAYTSHVAGLDQSTWQCPGCKNTVKYQLGNVNVYRGLASGNRCSTCHTPIQEFEKIEDGPDDTRESRVRHWHVTAEDDKKHNNTDLDGPSPKMDKSQGPGPKPDVPGEFVEKDPVEPIKATNEGELKEIGEIKHETLPSNSDDAGFDSGGPGPAPHTDTFGNDGQVDPVTNTALSSHNPLSDLLTSAFPPDAVVNEALLSLDE